MKRNILLNPGPATTTDTVKQALMVPDICPREEEFGELTQSVLKKIVNVVNGQATHSTVIFAGSGTAAVEAALCSVVAGQWGIWQTCRNNYQGLWNFT
jgi:2-aminoethylphosphonate-pyruvate transaminase